MVLCYILASAHHDHLRSQQLVSAGALPSAAGFLKEKCKDYEAHESLVQQTLRPYQGAGRPRSCVTNASACCISLLMHTLWTTGAVTPFSASHAMGLILKFASVQVASVCSTCCRHRRHLAGMDNKKPSLLYHLLNSVEQTSCSIRVLLEKAPGLLANLCRCCNT